ncbi:hypothetical protein BC938DRAFT_472288, partial [Jimgerdemannia flammicorona]
MFWGFRIFENCEEFNRKYDDVERPKFLRAFETLYGQRKGDFAMGDEVTYVDFLVYQLLLDEGGASTLTAHPNLRRLFEAVERRLNIAIYNANGRIHL